MSANHQLNQLNHLVQGAWGHNAFYSQKWRSAGLAPAPLTTLEQLRRFPLTNRAELVGDQNTAPPLGTNLTCPMTEIKRLHRSTGTTLSTLFWADTTVTWRELVDDTRELLEWAGVGPEDRVFVTLPFGSALVPWLIYEAVTSLGSAAFTAGDADAVIQLTHVQQFRPTVVIARSNRLASIAHAARDLGVALADLGVERVLTTGHIGGTHAATAGRLREQWAVDYYDCYMLTEAGAVAGECSAHPGGMHLLERSVLAEVIDPASGKPVPEGEPGELVLTTLRRQAQPIVRYRTGDLVRLRHHQCDCGRSGALVFGGVRRRDT